MNFSGRRTKAGLAVVLLLSAGCGQSDWGTLEGTVLLNGEPIGPGAISLEPVNEARAGALAKFGSDGKYAIQSSGRKPGAPIGEYRVFIRGGENLSAETDGPPPQSNIPPRYGALSGSDLTVTIEPGANTKDFDLQP